MTSRPTLVLFTTYFHASDQDASRELGLELYDKLCRPLDNLIGFGAGIPVFCAVEPEVVDLQAAETVVVIPVLGKTAHGVALDETIDQVTAWHERLGPGKVLPVLVDSVWRNSEARFAGKPFLTELYGDASTRRNATLDEIVLAVSRLLGDGSRKTSLFISHAKADLASTENAAEAISDYTKNSTTGHAFFDRAELLAGESLMEQIDFAVHQGVFVAVRGDSYSSRLWCQSELLRAKQHGVPTLTVEVLKRGERRSLPYGGNGPTITWTGDPAEVTSQAMVQWLSAAFFQIEAQRVMQAAQLPSGRIMVRPPELLDLAQGPLRSDVPQLVIHPDPELPVTERQVLYAANHRLHLVTPLTAYRRILSDSDSAPADAPLESRQVAMSLSESPDVDGPEGFTRHHVDDITIQLARALIGAGAAIAYGGDFRRRDWNNPQQQAYTLLLSQVIAAYNQTAAHPADFLHSYLSASIELGDQPSDVPLTLHHMVESKEMAELSVVPSPAAGENHPGSIYNSDMRRAMVECTQARIVLGGAAIPKQHQRGPGYGGRFPGVAEEAWRSLEKQQPLYVVGGFGGAAELVAGLLQDGPIPDRLRDASWESNSLYTEQADAFDRDPYHENLGLPDSLEELAMRIRHVGSPLFESDARSLAFNGLSVEDNLTLFRSRDPLTIVSLIMRGLLEINRREAAGKLPVELVRGSVTEARDLDVIAVATFDGIPLGGAGAALDRALGGRATMARKQGHSLISLGSNPEIGSDWVYLASLGEPGGTADMTQSIRRAAELTANVAQRYGLRKIGVVAFGGNVIADLKTVMDAMLDRLETLAGFASIHWFESDPERFEVLRKALRNETNSARVRLTTQLIKASTESPPPQKPEALILQVYHTDGELTITVLPPSGNAMASRRAHAITRDDLAALATGGGGEGRNTPDIVSLEERGKQLSRTLLGDDAEQLLSRTADARSVIVHDVASSRIPFEMLRSETSGPPAAGAGMTRRLAVPGVPLEQLFSRPPKSGAFNLLLVINPTGDLPGTVAEGNAVRAILDQQSGHIDYTVLEGSDATKDAVRDALATADVLHYCGHAFFDGPGETQSGLQLAGRVPLTLADLRGVPMPRMAFVNACEAGRVRGDNLTTEAASFAEFFLRSGVEAYLGTFWRVNDEAAKIFASGVYAQLASGKRLDEAVNHARKDLYDKTLPDWSNYLLYGEGRFQLVR